MKPAAIMERDFNGIVIHQNHQTQMINVTELVSNFNKVQGLTNDVDSMILNTSNVRDLENVVLKGSKRIDNYWRLNETKDFLNSLARSEGCTVQDLTIARRGKYGGTWAHPLIFVDICMWLSPDFKVAALKIVYDHLLEIRDQSGDEYKTMCKAMKDKKIASEKWDYARVAGAISTGILGTTAKGSWNIASATELQTRKDVETFIGNAISAGFITDFNAILKTVKNHCKDLEMKKSK